MADAEGEDAANFQRSPLNRFIRRARRHIREPSALLHISSLSQSTEEEVCAAAGAYVAPRYRPALLCGPHLRRS